MNPRSSSRLMVGASLAAVVLPSAFASGYLLFQLTMVLVYAIAILGLNLVSGYNGQVSLGHGAFYAMGAYVTTILMTTWDMSYWATLPVAAVFVVLAPTQAAFAHFPGRRRGQPVRPTRLIQTRRSQS